MKRRLPMAVAGLLAALLVVGAVAPATHGADAPRGQVVVLTLGNVNISEVRMGPMPFVRSLIDESAVGLANTLGVGRAELDMSSATIGAGARAQIKPGTEPAMNAGEPYEGGTAAEAYRRRAGLSTADASVVAVGIASLEGYNRSLPYHMIPGALGDAIVSAGGKTAAFGNADTSLGYEPAALHRESVYVAMDAEGRVRLGDVGKSMIKARSRAPFGLSTDAGALMQGYRRVRDKASLVVLDFGDTVRAEKFREFAEPRVAGRQRREALSKADRFARSLVAALPRDATLVILSPVGPEDRQAVNSLTPIIVHGPGFRGGLLTSPVTQRAGLVNGSDTAPTILRQLGLEIPPSFLGAPMTSEAAGEDTGERLDEIQATYDRASSEATARNMVTAVFAVVLAVAYMGVVVFLFSASTSRTMFGLCRWLLLLVISAPLASYLVWLVYPVDGPSSGMIGVYGMLILLIPTATFVTAGSSVEALTRICVATVGFIVVDQLFFEGGLAVSTFYSYSPIDGARYYGIGNEGWAILVGALLAATALSLDGLNLSKRALEWVVPLLFGGAVFVIGFPSLGANAGGVIGATAGLGSAYLQMRDRRIGLKQIVIIVVTVGVVLTAFAAYDATRPASLETHIGRSARLVTGKNGPAELLLLVERKALSNLKVMTRTKYSYVLLLILGVLALLRRKPMGLFAEVLRRYPSLAAATTGGLVGGFVGLLTEDSGVVIPAMIMMFIGAALALAMLETKFEEQGAAEPPFTSAGVSPGPT